MMSGTSLDGIDALAVKIFNDLSFEIINSHSCEYDADLKNGLYLAANNNASTADICALNFDAGKAFADCAAELMNKAGFSKADVDFISSHGQTVWHIPGNSTLQIGDISVISELTGIMTIGDFRPKDIAAGGQGAPLVPFADEIIFKHEKRSGILNLGGIANITVLSPDNDTFAFDIGPANMLIDYYVRKFFDKPYDQNGELAAKGSVNEKWLKILLNEKFYSEKPPKSTGRELFSEKYAEKMLESAPPNPHDIIATATALTAKTVRDAYDNFIKPVTSLDELILGGGGAYNLTLRRMLQEQFPDLKISTHEDYNIDNKFKEALAFAYLGYMTYHKKCNNLPTCTGATHPVIMGKISL